MSPIEELVELEAIKNVRYLYCHYFDGQQVDKLVDLFTDDAICEFGPMYGGDWVGKEQIRANYATYTEAEGIEHEVMHEGQLIRHLKALGQPLPSSIKWA